MVHPLHLLYFSVILNPPSPTFWFTALQNKEVSYCLLIYLNILMFQIADPLCAKKTALLSIIPLDNLFIMAPLS